MTTGEGSKVSGVAAQDGAGEIAIFGGGCFWCLEPVLAALQGVYRVECGYAGGHTTNPDYKSICTGATGHAEVVRVNYDPQMISFATLLDVFFCLHDPTTPNRQGHDVGTQYRSVVFWQSELQRTLAIGAIAQINASGAYATPVVTELTEAANAPAVGAYTPAEDYHQAYFSTHGHEPYCSAVIAPKVAKCRQRFAALLRPAGADA